MNKPNAETTEKPAVAERKDPVKRWTIILLFAVVLTLGLYLVADRHTPFTSQARVNAYVIPIAPEVSGAVIAVEAMNNQTVAAGDVLFRIDPSQYQLAVEAAQAAYQSVAQSVDAGASNVDAARATVEAAKARVWQSQQDADRMRRIRKEDPGAISTRRVESAEASLAAAKSQLTAAQAGLQAAISALGDTDEHNSGLQQAQSTLDQAQLNLERTTVRAPRDGLITDLRVDIGNFAAAGAAQMTFISMHDSWIQADLTENNLGHVDVGDRVGIVFDVQPGRVYSGKVRHVGYGVQVDSNPLGTLPTVDNQRTFLREAQRFPVQIELQDIDAGRLGLRVGSQASVVVYTGNNPIVNGLARLYLRAQAILSYAY